MAYLDLDQTLTPEQVTLRHEVHRFAAEVLRPAALELDAVAAPEAGVKRGSVVWDVYRRSYEQGYHVRNLPEAMGGAGLSIEEQIIVSEEFGWGAADFAVGLGVTSFPFLFAGGSGNPELIKDVVRPFIEDKEAHYIGCWAITEPNHGPATLAVGTQAFRAPNVFYGLTARADRYEWVLTGPAAAWVPTGPRRPPAPGFPGSGQAGRW